MSDFWLMSIIAAVLLAQVVLCIRFLRRVDLAVRAMIVSNRNMVASARDMQGSLQQIKPAMERIALMLSQQRGR